MAGPQIDLRRKPRFVNEAAQRRSRAPRHRQDRPHIGHFAAMHAIQKFRIRRDAPQIEEIVELIPEAGGEQGADDVDRIGLGARLGTSGFAADGSLYGTAPESALDARWRGMFARIAAGTGSSRTAPSPRRRSMH